jgi:Raf kinase inhibitor-like YbhB/YbcL family protein
MQQLAGNASAVGFNGTNSFGQAKYQGPCPPIGRGPHRYFFKLYALDIDTLHLKVGAVRNQVETAIESHILGQAQLMGKYERK